MSEEKRLKKSEALSKELEASKKTRGVKSVLKKLDPSDTERVEKAVTIIRTLFPDVDRMLSPRETIEGLGFDLDLAKACPICLSSKRGINLVEFLKEVLLLFWSYSNTIIFNRK